MLSNKTLYQLEVYSLAKEYNRKILNEIEESISSCDIEEITSDVEKLDFTLEFEQFYEKCQELDRKYRKVLCKEGD